VDSVPRLSFRQLESAANWKRLPQAGRQVRARRGKSRDNADPRAFSLLPGSCEARKCAADKHIDELWVAFGGRSDKAEPEHVQ